MNWQLIETAPKGRVHIDSCGIQGGGYCDCDMPHRIVLTYGPAGIRFGKQDEHGQWRNMMNRPMIARPTHWMPLPDPPLTNEDN